MIYTAALKDRGKVGTHGLLRMEIPAEISETTYQYYRSQLVHPVIHKLRASPIRDVIVDWTEGDDRPVIEIENLGSSPDAQRFYVEHKRHLVDRTGDPSVSSEAQAYAMHTGEIMPMPQDLNAQAVAIDILAGSHAVHGQYVVGISGRSGSGKSTLTREVISILKDYGARVETVSTDDYHRGKKWLEAIEKPWTNWDAPEVYDTNALSADIWKLSQGEAVQRHRFDFVTEEPVHNGIVEPKDILIVEGIYAGSPDLDVQRHQHIAIPTPLATSIGRRLARDQKEARLNESLGGLSAILRYQLEIAEPAYQRQQELA